MSEHADKLVFLEPTEVQKLRLALAQRDCDVNIARRCHIESEMRLYQLVLSVAEAGLPMIRGELTRLEEEAAQLTQTFFEVGEQIKAENNWPTAVRWDATTLKYTAPLENGWTTMPVQAGENKIRIQ